MIAVRQAVGLDLGKGHTREEKCGETWTLIREIPFVAETRFDRRVALFELFETTARGRRVIALHFGERAFNVCGVFSIC
jgi:hypothetical protein